MAIFFAFIASHSAWFVGIGGYLLGTLGSTQPAPVQPLPYYKQWAYNFFQAVSASRKH